MVRHDVDYSVVEGIVSYYGTGNTRETSYSPGFILIDCNWILNPPPEKRSVMYLVGEVDSSLMHKHIRAEGTYQIPIRIHNPPEGTPDYTSDMYLRILKLEVIK